MSIKTQALLVSVTINQPTKSRQDKGTADEVARAKKADSNTVRIINDLYPKHLMQPIEKVVGQARTHANGPMTYMWDRNSYLLPMTDFMEFAQRAGEIELAFDQGVTAFLNNWANVLLAAQAERGDFYDDADYPDVETLRRQFRLKFRYRPVTDDSDFRVRADEDALQELVAKAQAESRELFADLAMLPAETLTSKLEKLREAMLKPDREFFDDNNQLIDIKPPIFRDTTFDNGTRECQKIIDFGDDVLLPETVALAGRIKHEMHSPEDARKDAMLRKEIAAQCAEWIAELNGSTTVVDEEQDVNPMGLDELIDTDETEYVADSDTLNDAYALEPNPSRGLLAEIDDMFGDD